MQDWPGPARQTEGDPCQRGREGPPNPPGGPSSCPFTLKPPLDGPHSTRRLPGHLHTALCSVTWRPQTHGGSRRRGDETHPTAHTGLSLVRWHVCGRQPRAAQAMGWLPPNTPSPRLRCARQHPTAPQSTCPSAGCCLLQSCAPHRQRSRERF